MSILNTYLAADRALVAVDTHIGTPDQVQHGSKLLTLPHAPVVIAMRGEFAFFSVLSQTLHLLALRDIDAMTDAMPALLEDIYAQRLKMGRPGEFPFQGIELALVGWSPRHGRMRGTRWERWPDADGFKATPVDPWSMSPNPGYQELPPAPDTAERMEAVARDQLAVLRRLPGVIAGGRLLLAELSRSSISVRALCDLETPADVGAADGDGHAQA